MICDVCGYEHDAAVNVHPDGIIRCRFCADQAVYGDVKFTTTEQDREDWINHKINQPIEISESLKPHFR